MSYDPDEMMLELFRAEVESHSDSLTNSLLKLEQDPEATSVLDGMMRAAHSIKGAARIVRVGPAVEVAHVMEDCFVAAQRGELLLEPNGIDVLLRAVDLLVKISDASKNPRVEWSDFDSTIHTSVEQLRCVLNGQSIPSSEKAIEATPPSLAPVLAVETTELPVAITETIQTSPSPLAEFIPTELRETASEAIQDHREELAPVQRLVLPEVLGKENAESLRLRLLSLFEKYESVELDFTQMKDLDALGLAWLHSAVQHARKVGTALMAVNVAASMNPILELVGLQDRKDLENG